MHYVIEGGADELSVRDLVLTLCLPSAARAPQYCVYDHSSTKKKYVYVYMYVYVWEYIYIYIYIL